MVRASPSAIVLDRALHEYSLTVMPVLTVIAGPSPWARATLVLLATLLVHAWVLERVQRSLAGAPPPEPLATVAARLLPPPVAVAPPPAVAPPMPRPRPVRTRRPAPAAPQPVTSVPDATPIPATNEVSPTADAGPAAAAPPEPEFEAALTSPPVAMNAERPAESGAAAEAIEFDAAGPALHVALARLPAVNAALPAAARYVYRTTNSELRVASGTTTVDWSLAADGRYRLRLATTTIGMTLLELESQGMLRAFGLAPERYVETRVRRGAAAANFDWEVRRVTFSARTHEQPLPDGVQDRISFQFQLMLLGQALPERFKPGRQTVLRIASRDDVSTYRLRSAGRDTTSTGIGTLDTVKVERVVERESDAKVEVWLAPDHGWLPARLRFTDRHGRITESVLESTSAP